MVFGETTACSTSQYVIEPRGSVFALAPIVTHICLHHFLTLYTPRNSGARKPP